MRSASPKFLRAASSTVWLPAVPLAGVTVSQSASSPVTVSVQSAEAEKVRVAERLSRASSVYSVCSMTSPVSAGLGLGSGVESSLLQAARATAAKRRKRKNF